MTKVVDWDGEEEVVVVVLVESKEKKQKEEMLTTMRQMRGRMVTGLTVTRWRSA
jgi:hypothetical protein